MPPVEYGVAAPEGQLPVMDVPHEAAEAVAAAEDTAAAATAGAAAPVAVGAGYEAEAAPPAIEEAGGVMQGEEPQDAVQAAVEVVDDLLPAPAPVADPTKCSIAGCDLPPVLAVTKVCASSIGSRLRSTRPSTKQLVVASVAPLTVVTSKRGNTECATAMAAFTTAISRTVVRSLARLLQTSPMRS